MANNELLRSLRDALALDTATMSQIFKAAGVSHGFCRHRPPGCAAGWCARKSFLMVTVKS